MDFKEALEKLKANPELAKSLEDAVKNRVDPTEFYGILIDGGLDQERAEQMAAEYQRNRGLSVADEEVDDDMLRKVAGGGCGTDCSQANDCDMRFKDSYWWGEERCIYSNYCDEVFENGSDEGLDR